MRTYIKIMALAFQQSITYRFESWAGALIGVSQTVVFLSLWFAVARNDAQVLAEVFAYITVTRLLSEVHVTDAFGMLAQSVRTGSVAVELLKPISYPLRLGADSLGRAGWRLLRAVPVYLVIGWLLKIQWPDGSTLALFLLSAALGWVIDILILLLVASVIFWVIDMEGLHNVLEFTRTVFAGVLIPFWMLPDWFRYLAAVLPFQAAVYVPGAIFAGRLTGANLWLALGSQLVWIALLGATLNWAWRAAAQKVVVQGG